jgi:hypothetical protein
MPGEEESSEVLRRGVLRKVVAEALGELPLVRASRKLTDRLDSHRAIEMAVQVGLGQSPHEGLELLLAELFEDLGVELGHVVLS